MKLTARKSTGGKAPRDIGPILKCDKCWVILTTQDKLDQHTQTCLVSKNPTAKVNASSQKKPISPNMTTKKPSSPNLPKLPTKPVSPKNNVSPLTMLPKKPVLPKNSGQKQPNILKPAPLRVIDHKKHGSQNYIGTQVKIFVKPFILLTVFPHIVSALE